LRFHREARDSAYDVIVVGSGIGGLTSAGLLASQGKKVLVVERHDRPGGYAHGFKRKRYHFDSAVHLIGGCGDGPYDGSGLVRRLLEVMGVADRCEFEAVHPFYSAVFPDFRLDVPTGIEAFIEAHVGRFPGEERGFRELMTVCLAIREESLRAPDLLSPTDFGRMASYVPTLVRYHRATLADVMDEYIDSPQLKAVFGTLWPYLGLPPSRVSFLYWAMMMLSYVVDGAWYCKGGFQQLASALADGIEGFGGELLLKSSVRRIRVEGRVARGVVLENGQQIDAPVVISNADATQTYDELIGAGQVPRRVLAGVRGMEPSLSAFVLYGATSLDLRAAGAAHEMFYYKTWDHDEDYANLLRGQISRIGFTVPSLADPTLAPEGEDLFTVTVLLPHELSSSWRDEKDFYSDLLLTEADAVMPGLRDGLQYAEGATPRTMERYTRNLSGAMYGWALTPKQVGPMRLGQDSPIDGLFLAGHWTIPGGGVYGVCQSGVRAAQSVLGLKREADLWTAVRQSSALL
jgi:prolycopene isomerase